MVRSLARGSARERSSTGLVAGVRRNTDEDDLHDDDESEEDFGEDFDDYERPSYLSILTSSNRSGDSGSRHDDDDDDDVDVERGLHAPSSSSRSALAPVPDSLSSSSRRAARSDGWLGVLSSSFASSLRGGADGHGADGRQR